MRKSHAAGWVLDGEWEILLFVGHTSSCQVASIPVSHEDVVNSLFTITCELSLASHGGYKMGNGSSLLWFTSLIDDAAEFFSKNELPDTARSLRDAIIVLEAEWTDLQVKAKQSTLLEATQR